MRALIGQKPMFYQIVFYCFSPHYLYIIKQMKKPKSCITYILLTKREGRTGRISARGLDSTDRAQRGPYKKDRGPIFS